MASKLSIRRAQVHVPDTCAWCESVQDVNWYCNDCQEALCDRCFEGHQRARKTRNDDVVPIKEANKLGEAVLPEVCKSHRGKTCDLYCCECDIAMCAVCLTEKHKQHAFKNIENEIVSQQHDMQDQLKILKSKLKHFDDNLSKRHQVNKSFKESVDIIQQNVQTQRLKLKTKIDSMADSVMKELSSLVEEEDKIHKQDCKSYEQNINEINQFIRDIEQNTDKTSSTSLFELAGRLRTTIPLYDVITKTVVPSLPNFVTGKLNPDQLKPMIGYVGIGKSNEEDTRYERKGADSKISTFRVPHQNEILSICPVDDTNAWMAVRGSTELIKVNKEGNVTESVKLDFIPWYLTITKKKELLITCSVDSPLIHKLTKDRRVTRFADIRPLKAFRICVSDSDEVFVTTATTTIQVLNKSGKRIRQISCGGNGLSVVCLTTGNIAVNVHSSDGFRIIFIDIINKTEQITHEWSGELCNGLWIDYVMILGNIARDRYDRVFVPHHNDQVYVLSGSDRKAKRFLDQKHGVKGPSAVCVDRCGHVWIGCADGTVHVMEL